MSCLSYIYDRLYNRSTYNTSKLFTDGDVRKAKLKRYWSEIMVLLVIYNLLNIRSSCIFVLCNNHKWCEILFLMLRRYEK